MNQLEEFEQQIAAVREKEEKVLIVTGKPGSGKSKLMRKLQKPRAGTILTLAC